MNDKEVFQIIQTRRSIRKDKDIPIKDDILLTLIKAGRYAPSGSNSQCYRFIIITNKDDINFLGKAKIPIVANSKAIILIIADLSTCDYLKGNRKKVFDKLPYQDCAMAMQNIVLLAHAKGLGSCIVHLSKEWHSYNDIMKRFNLNINHELQGLITLGYSDEIIDYKTATHAGRPIKRKAPEFYLLDWRT